MLRRRHVLVLITALFSLSGVALFGPRDRVAADNLPKQLSDRAFWKLVTEFSEPTAFSAPTISSPTRRRSRK